MADTAMKEKKFVMTRGFAVIIFAVTSLLGTTTTTMIATATTTAPSFFGNANDGNFGSTIEKSRVIAPVAITGDNIYVAWWTNNTENGNDEVMFRASTDAGATFGDKVNLSNTTDANSTRVEIDSDADNVVVTWWETNQTSDTPVMRVSQDNGATFGSVLRLAANGTIANTEEEGEQ